MNKFVSICLLLVCLATCGQAGENVCQHLSSLSAPSNVEGGLWEPLLSFQKGEAHEVSSEHATFPTACLIGIDSDGRSIVSYETGGDKGRSGIETNRTAVTCVSESASDEGRFRTVYQRSADLLAALDAWQCRLVECGYSGEVRRADDSPFAGRWVLRHSILMSDKRFACVELRLVRCGVPQTVVALGSWVFKLDSSGKWSLLSHFDNHEDQRSSVEFDQSGNIMIRTQRHGIECSLRLQSESLRNYHKIVEESFKSHVEKIKHVDVSFPEMLFGTRIPEVVKPTQSGMAKENGARGFFHAEGFVSFSVNGGVSRKLSVESLRDRDSGLIILLSVRHEFALGEDWEECKKFTLAVADRVECEYGVAVRFDIGKKDTSKFLHGIAKRADGLVVAIDVTKGDENKPSVFLLRFERTTR